MHILITPALQKETYNFWIKNISFAFDKYRQFTLEWLSSTVWPRRPEGRRALLTMCSPYKEMKGMRDWLRGSETQHCIG